MKPETYKEVKEKLEKLKKQVLCIEKAIKSKKVKEIERSIKYAVYDLHRIHKKATNKTTQESMKEISRSPWEIRDIKEGEQRKHRDVKKIYSIWAKEYDTQKSNLLIFIESKSSGEFIKGVKNKEILDYGCGTGRYALSLAKKEASVTAIDFNNAMLKRAKEKAKKAKLVIDFKKQDITKYKPKKKFDLIISMLVLDHIKNLKQAVNIMNKASKIGTSVVISNIHPTLILAGLKKGKGPGWLTQKYKTDQYYHPIEKYIELFLEKGFVLTKIKDLLYEKEYHQKRFRKFTEFEKKPFGIIMKFEKIK